MTVTTPFFFASSLHTDETLQSMFERAGEVVNKQDATSPVSGVLYHASDEELQMLDTAFAFGKAHFKKFIRLDNGTQAWEYVPILRPL